LCSTAIIIFLSLIQPPPTAVFTLSLHAALPIFLVCALADHTGRGRAVAGAAIVILPLATLGGLVVLPALCAWWVLGDGRPADRRSEEHTSELQSRENLVCRLLLEKKKRTLHIGR